MIFFLLFYINYSADLYQGRFFFGVDVRCSRERPLTPSTGSRALFKCVCAVETTGVRAGAIQHRRTFTHVEEESIELSLQMRSMSS